MKSLIGLLVIFLTACSQTSEIPEGGSDIHGALHRIEHNGNTVYLFGTMHVADREAWFPLADVVEKALRRADVVGLEVDLTWRSYSDRERMAIQNFLEEGVLLEDGQTLESFLAVETYENLRQQLPTFGIDYADVYRLNPVALRMMATVQLTQEILAEQGALAEGLGVDGYIMQFAMQQGIPILGLEPMMQHVRIGFVPDEAILASAGFSYSAEDIMQAALVDLPSRQEMLAQMAGDLSLPSYYYSNDLEEINALFQVSSEEMENPFARYFVDVLMNYRSIYYANEIVRLLAESENTTFFIAVGLSHIMREGPYLTNIVEQLAEQGIQAVPMFE